jgi:glycosyltransferase involved in cell wall biosynthesis
MLLNSVYYSLKPYLPWSVRIGIRRLRAKRRRAMYADVWPIDSAAGPTPPGWPGWPSGKQFAVILTHDVEGQKGLDRIRSVVDLEKQHGFRSSFNFVPEGSYSVPDELRQMLDEAGFEVGVHGLEHDGKLFSSKEEFASKASRISAYLQRWNAVGFRSPLMQHRLGWLHQIGAEYDSSTFDTDPFEPEPDGVRTVFPFWVPGPLGGGYVELPYTLIQDFNLFMVLREQNIDVWKRKVDWIVSRGGMVLLNTHPDYMCFEGTKPERDEYPVSRYTEFLRYLQENYAGQFWSALPKEAARYYCASVPVSSRNSRKRICMVAYTTYEHDNRVRRYAEALASRGDLVDVIALASTAAPLGVEQMRGVSVHRIQNRTFDERSKWTYAWRLLRFCWVSSVFFNRRHSNINYDLVHVHNIPDFLVYAAWYGKLTGAKVILDIHDIVPELFASKFKTAASGMYVGFLKALEKACAGFADHVIVSNHLWRDTLISRSVGEEKCTVFMNHVDPAIFYRRHRTRTDGKVIILFPGTFQWHQGLDIAIEALALIKDRVPGAELHLYGGGGGTEGELRGLADRLGLNGRVQFRGGVPLDKIPDVIVNADLGIVPKRADSFGNEAYSTKIMEFMSQGLPVVASRTKIDTFYFDDSVVRFFRSGDPAAMAEAMLAVIEDKVVRESLIKNGYEYAERNSWSVRRKDYFELVDKLTAESFGLTLPVRPKPIDVGRTPVV